MISSVDEADLKEILLSNSLEVSQFLFLFFKHKFAKFDYFFDLSNYN